MTKLGLLCGLVLTLVLGACGGNDDSNGNQDNGVPVAPTGTARGGEGSGGNGSGTGSDTDADFHACSLFTGAELGEILGLEMNDGRDYLATAAKATGCVWEGDVVVHAEVLLEGGEDWYDAIHFGESVGEVEEIDGLGDIALWDEFLGTLDVVDGDRFISLQPLVGFSGMDSKEVAIELAPMALERLP